ncbi:MAG: Crp/Fnr family transcriptional regulator [Gammaproteobacteria bacterium]|nr:MAG: Crp/Fnr family transcriptional regulator [Gammaproteobacteria bacterium]
MEMSQLQPKPGEPTRCLVCPIRNLALFEAVKEELLDWTQKFRTQQYVLESRRHIYKEGDRITESYTLFDGWVMLYKSLKDGKRQILRFALPGDFLGYQIDEDIPVNHSALAITNITACGFPHTSLLELFRQQPELGMRLASLQQRDMSYCYDHMMSVGQKSALESISSILVELHDRSIERDPEGVAADYFPLSQEEIADYVGITFVHVSRVMKEMRKDGLIETGNRKIRVKDISALRQAAKMEQKSWV